MGITPITDAAGLAGKRVATVFGSTAHNMVQKFLATAGLTINDIQLVNIAASDAEQVLSSGHILIGQCKHKTEKYRCKELQHDQYDNTLDHTSSFPVTFLTASAAKSPIHMHVAKRTFLWSHTFVP